MDARSTSPSAQRNREPILEVLRRVLPAHARVLEIASGTGEHAIWFGRHLPEATIQPSDPDPVQRASIDAWRAASQLENVLPALSIDVSRKGWEEAPEVSGPFDAVVCINMIHIAPWEAALGLLRGAARLLTKDGVLLLYGPYRQGVHTAPSNAAFDASLRERNPAWGVRELEEVAQAARSQGFGLAEVVPMPANNLSLVLRAPGGVKGAPQGRARP